MRLFTRLFAILLIALLTPVAQIGAQTPAASAGASSSPEVGEALETYMESFLGNGDDA